MLTEGTTTNIAWNSFNVTGTVDIAISANGTTFSALASGIANSGTYAWTIDPAVFAPGSNYLVKVSSSANPATFGVSSAPFTISVPVTSYYINDAIQAGDQYTTAIGSDLNSGLSPDQPMATLSGLLAKYSLTPGSIVYVDTGNYSLTNNIVFNTAQSGTGDLPNQRLTIQGPTNTGVTATFNRGSNSSGFEAFEFNGASYVTLANLHITGGSYGVALDDNSMSVGVTVQNSQIDGNLNGVYVGTGDDNFTLTSSHVSATGRYGIDIEHAANTVIVGDQFNQSVDAGTVVNLNFATGGVLRNDVIVNGGINAADLTAFESTNLLVDSVTASGGYYGLMATSSTGVFQNNTVNATGGAFGISINGFGGKISAIGNTIFGENSFNSSEAGLTVGTNAFATNNVIYNNNVGLLVTGSTAPYGQAVSNRVFGNVIGILATQIRPSAAIRCMTTPRELSQKVYDNTTAGIQVGRFFFGTTPYEILNNTIVQTSGAAIVLQSSPAPSGVDIRNNIFSLTNAVGIVAPTVAQSGFNSDYNLFDLFNGSTVSIWSDQSFVGLADWKTEIGFDRNSFVADPLFTNPAGADGIRGYVGGVDHGADDDFKLASGSPAIDRGDPASQFFQELTGVGFGDGARINIGAAGDTAAANNSPSQLVQLLGSTGGERYQVGQTATINFRSDGLTSQSSVLFINVGGGEVVGTQPWNAFQPDEFRIDAPSSSSTLNSVDISQVDAPAAVFRTFAQSFSSSGIAYQIPVTDGNYQVRLLFNDPFSFGAGQNQFDIVANNTTFQSNYDIFAAAGGANRATSFTFNTSATGGSGIQLDLKAKLGAALLSGIEITRILPPQPTWTASLDVSLDNGQSWSNITAGVALDRLGAGSFSWTPGLATSGYSALLRVTATDGTHTLVDQSIAPFMVAPAGHAFYINDGATAGDQYTTAVGNDLNSGKSPDAPMAKSRGSFQRLQAAAGRYSFRR